MILNVYHRLAEGILPPGLRMLLKIQPGQIIKWLIRSIECNQCSIVLVLSQADIKIPFNAIIIQSEIPDRTFSATGAERHTAFRIAEIHRFILKKER